MFYNNISYFYMCAILVCTSLLRMHVHDVLCVLVAIQFCNPGKLMLPAWNEANVRAHQHLYTYRLVVVGLRCTQLQRRLAVVCPFMLHDVWPNWI